jgi:hypothetical protein
MKAKEHMREIPTYWASGVNPRVWIRSAWIEPTPEKTTTGPKSRKLAIGDALALEFDDHKLVCTPWPIKDDVLTPEEVSEYALAPFGIYARWVPIDTALDDLDMSRRIGIQLGEEASSATTEKSWPIPNNGVWYDMGRVSDHLAMTNETTTVRMRWDFEFKNNGLLITPEFGTEERKKSLVVCNTFDLVELTTIPNGEPVTGRENWRDFCQRYPPRYPTEPSHAWGWLLPNAPNAVEAQGFKFKSVMAYALNPILRLRAASGQSNESSDLEERLASGARHRISQDEQFARLVALKSIPVKQLALAAPQKHRTYWRALIEARQQAP